MKSGVYKISFNSGYYFYIGSSINLNNRKRSHLSRLIRNAHYNKKMQNVFNEYKDFNFEILEFVAVKNLLCKEQSYLDNLKPNLNIQGVANRPFGHKHKPETIVKLIKIANERKISKDWIDGVSKGWFKKGYKVEHSEETIKKRIESYMGYKHREDSKLKMSISAKERDNSTRDYTTFNKIGIELTKKPVVQICTQTNAETAYPSITEAIKQFNTKQTRHLVMAIKTGKVYKKSLWKYANKTS